MPKCAYIDNGVTIGPGGDVRPCCHIYHSDISNKEYEDFNWKNSFPKLRKIMENGWAKECDYCRIEEIKKGESPRTKLDHFGIEGNQKTIFDLKITNTCNLSCRMCNPTQSSTWDKIVKTNKNIDFQKHYDVIEPLEGSAGWHNKFLSEVKNNLDNVKYLKFTGGEPFLVKHTKEVCKYTVESGASNSTELKFITNGQVVLDEEWFKIFSKYKDVQIDVSVDGVGSRYEYIRPGSKWSKIEDFINNIKKRDMDIDLCITYLPQTLNAAVFYETEQWAVNHGLEIHNHAYWQLKEPEFMNYSSLNPSVRKKLNIETDVVYKEENFKKLVDYMSALDRIYGTDMKQECPELFNE